MPVRVGAKIRRMGQEEFGEIAYGVMRVAFQVQGELGRLCDEKIYRRELAFRLPGARTEVPIELEFEDFAKTYYMDLVVGDGAIFELKAVDCLAPRHRGQLLNYLLLADAAHGKLINFRTERVQHEFVNNTLTHADRIAFTVENRCWENMDTGDLAARMISLLRDWGTGLDIALYEEVAAHFCGRTEMPYDDVEFHTDGRSLGLQQVRVAAPEVGLRISAFPPDQLASFEIHLRLFLDHTSLRAIQWINIVPHIVHFTTLLKDVLTGIF